MELEAVVDALRGRLEREPGLVAAWLFGSVARGTARPSSDVDVAVLFETEPSVDVLFDLEADLGELVRAPAQLVSARRAGADLFHRVLRDGVLLVDRDRAARIRFEVASRNRYFDMRPIWMEYRKSPVRE